MKASHVVGTNNTILDVQCPRVLSDWEVALCAVPVLNKLEDCIWFRETVEGNSDWVQASRTPQERFLVKD